MSRGLRYLYDQNVAHYEVRITFRQTQISHSRSRMRRT